MCSAKIVCHQHEYFIKSLFKYLNNLHCGFVHSSVQLFQKFRKTSILPLFQYNLLRGHFYINLCQYKIIFEQIYRYLGSGTQFFGILIVLDDYCIFCVISMVFFQLPVQKLRFYFLEFTRQKHQSLFSERYNYRRPLRLLNYKMKKQQWTSPHIRHQQGQLGKLKNSPITRFS